MTHSQAILHELALHGQTTYARLMARYGDAGYTYNGFTAAVHNLRASGVLERDGKAIVARHCPTCGRTMEARQ